MVIWHHWTTGHTCRLPAFTYTTGQLVTCTGFQNSLEAETLAQSWAIYIFSTLWVILVQSNFVKLWCRKVCDRSACSRKVAESLFPNSSLNQIVISLWCKFIHYESFFLSHETSTSNKFSYLCTPFTSDPVIYDHGKTPL